MHAFGTLALEREGPPIPLLACSGDQPAAIFASGEPATTTGFVNAGTGAFVQRVVRNGGEPPPRGLLKSVVCARGDDPQGALHCHEGTVNGAQAALEWLRGRVGIDVPRTLAALRTGVAPERVTLLFMNGVGGLAAPFWLPAFESAFVDLDGEPVAVPDETQQVAAVVDSIAFLIATNVALMQRAAPLRKLVLTGGLAGVDYLCEVLADATGLQVERPALHEATARGIAFLAAGQPAEWQPAPVERTFLPGDREIVLERFRRWRAAMERRGAVSG
jgi:glycerol kinase